MDSRPIIAITLGDVAGVGPEIVVKALALEKMYALCRPLVVGDASVLALARQMLGLPVDLHPVADVGGGRFQVGSIDVLDLANIDLAKLKMGEVSAMTGKAALEYVLKAGGLGPGWQSPGHSHRPSQQRSHAIGRRCSYISGILSR